MRILLTGAQSWLGRVLVDRLGRDHQLLVLGESVDGAVGAAGRLGDEASLRRALEGVQVALHLAAATGEDGTSGVLEAAAWCRVRRVVWVGPAGPRALAASGVAVLEPAALLGPGHPGGPPPLLRAWLGGRLGAAVSFVDVRDVGGAVEAAMSRGPTGVAMPLASAKWTTARFSRALAELTGRDAPQVGQGDPVEPIDSHVARESLGWWTRSPERTLRDTLAEVGELRG